MATSTIATGRGVSCRQFLYLKGAFAFLCGLHFWHINSKIHFITPWHRMDTEY